MRILHTADWHLGDRLGRIDRSDDLHQAVARVAAHCRNQQADVLLVAGDLFSELARPDGLRQAVRHVQETFRDFLQSGGTILALTGNHDNENFCQTLCHAMGLAAPVSDEPGAVLPAGRLYLAARPTFLRLADRREGFPVQFLLLPYPTPSRYLDHDARQRYQSVEERNQLLHTACLETLAAFRTHPAYDAGQPTVLAAHVNIRGSTVGSLFRISEQEDVVLDPHDLPADLAYVALGHIHKAQALGGLSHVRYSGSIERMDLGESADTKGVVLVEVGPKGRTAEPRVLPLEATPVYEVQINNPGEDLPGLADLHPDASRALVHVHVTYASGRDNLEATLRELEDVFPRWYARDWKEVSELTDPIHPDDGSQRALSFEDTVRNYLTTELQNHPETVRQAVLAHAEKLMRDEVS